jgi:para-nitrobenzyl esterase
VKSVEGLAKTAHPLYGGWTYAAVTLYLFKAMIDRQRGSEQASDDMLVACPVGAMAGLTRAQGGKVFVYRFDRSIPGKGELTLGAFHTLELPYVFNAFHNRSWRWLAFTAADDRLAGVIETYWTNFAKTGSPNSPGTPEWPAWESEGGSYMEFAPNGTPESEQHFAPAFCDLSLETLRAHILSGN